MVVADTPHWQPLAQHPNSAVAPLPLAQHPNSLVAPLPLAQHPIVLLHHCPWPSTPILLLYVSCHSTTAPMPDKYTFQETDKQRNRWMLPSHKVSSVYTCNTI